MIGADFIFKKLPDLLTGMLTLTWYQLNLSSLFQHLMEIILRRHKQLILSLESECGPPSLRDIRQGVGTLVIGMETGLWTREASMILLIS